ncbi:MAG TPA: hypothetical protein PK208_08890, partial [Fibrobacteria bacterium]|nr:hypothetical protein [Fibrobacteria bacterium]
GVPWSTTAGKGRVGAIHESPLRLAAVVRSGDPLQEQRTTGWKACVAMDSALREKNPSIG